MRDAARTLSDLFAAVVADCDPEKAFDARVAAAPGSLDVSGATIHLGDVDDVRVLALGKPSRSLVRACGRALARASVPAASLRGIAAVPEAHARAERASGRFPWMRWIGGGHPLPDSHSLDAGRRMLDACAGATERTLVLALVGGGGSAMAEWPAVPGTTAADAAAVSASLIGCDIAIGRVNALRKRLSAIKGGRLAIAARPARVVTIVVSDVEPGDLASVASGPTLEDTSRRSDAIAALDALADAGHVATVGGRPLVATDLVEPPAWTVADRDRSTVVALLDVRDALASTVRRATKAFDVVVDLGCVDGPVDEAAAAHVQALRDVTSAHRGRRCAVVSAGECTIAVRGDGRGGRNQHFVLTALIAAATAGELDDFAILGAGTDGRDGPTDAAGAIATDATIDAGRRIGLDARAARDAFDSWSFFDRVDGLIRTGPTETNVRDVRVLAGIRR